MEKYKIIQRTVSKVVFERKEERIPLWWYRFLLWLFGREEETLNLILQQERKHAWDKGYSDASNTAHSSKEMAMQKKLEELGYDVSCNFPMARELGGMTQPQFDPALAWEVKRKKLTN